MGTVRKAINKAERVAASNTGLYRRMRERALRRPVVLPGREEALAVLDATSPQPGGGLEVGPRT
jgi:hypothetical protein